GGDPRAQPDRAFAAGRGRLTHLLGRLQDAGGHARGGARRDDDLRLLCADAPSRPCARAEAHPGGTAGNVALLFSAIFLVVGGLLLAYWAMSRRRPALSVRLARAEGAAPTHSSGLPDIAELPRPAWLQGLLARYERDLRQVGHGKTLQRLGFEKLLLAAAV